MDMHIPLMQTEARITIKKKKDVKKLFKSNVLPPCSQKCVFV